MWLYRDRKQLKPIKAKHTLKAVLAHNFPHAILRACWLMTGATNSCALPVCGSWAKVTPFSSIKQLHQRVELPSLPGGSFLLGLRGSQSSRISSPFSCVASPGHDPDLFYQCSNNFHFGELSSRWWMQQWSHSSLNWLTEHQYIIWYFNSGLMAKMYWKKSQKSQKSHNLKW